MLLDNENPIQQLLYARHLDDLLKRITNENVLAALKKSNIGFFHENTHYLAAKEKITKSDPRFKPTGTCRQFEDFPLCTTTHDPRFPEYNANQYASGHYIAEGPDPTDNTAVTRFIESIWFNQFIEDDIQLVFVLGRHDEGAKFEFYFKPGTQHFGPWKLHSTETQKTDELVEYEVQFSQEDGRQKTITLINIIQMPDHGIATLSNNSLKRLLEITTQVKPLQILAHCAAGYGRSPLFLFALTLLNNFNQFFSGNNKQILSNILDLLTKMRDIRPPSIQQFPQLMQAIKLAIQFKQIEISITPSVDQVNSVCLIGCFDSKAADYEFIYQLLLSAGVTIYTIDTGVFTDKQTCPFPIDFSMIEYKGPIPANDVRSKKNRPAAIALIKENIDLSFRRLFDQVNFSGIIGIGGTNGTELIAAAMRQLPNQIGKVLVSTVAQHENHQYVRNSTITLINSIADCGGLNFISRQVYSQAANMLLGSMRCPPTSPSQTESNKPTVAITMFGNTNPAVDFCKVNLEKIGYEVCIFHATGSGGANMQALVDEGRFVAVIDMTTTELTDFVVGGVFACNRRFFVEQSKHGTPQIPWIVVPGCLEMLNMNDESKARQQFPGHTVIKCNEDVTVVHLNIIESAEVGKQLAIRVNEAAKAGTPIAVMLPLKSLSMFGAEPSKGGIPHWRDDYSRQIIVANIKKYLDPEVPLGWLHADINDKTFANECCRVLFRMLQNQQLDMPRQADSDSLSQMLLSQRTQATKLRTDDQAKPPSSDPTANIKTLL